MSLEKRLKKQRTRRKFRVRNKLLNKGNVLRVSVFRSLKNIYAQVIDDSAHTTVASVSSLSLKEVDKKTDKSEVARLVGVELGKIAKSQSVTKVFFDRGPYRYHGRVKALADGLREGGLEF